MAAACLPGQPRGEVDHAAVVQRLSRASLDAAGRESQGAQGPSIQRPTPLSVAPQLACPSSSDTSNQRLDLTKGSIKRIKETGLTTNQHSNSCPSLPALARPTAAPVPGPSAFASHSKQSLAAPIEPAHAAEACDVQPAQDVHPMCCLSRAYTAPAAIGPTTSSRASLFPAPRACPTGLDRFGSFAAMLVFGHHHPDELAAVAAGRDGGEHSASYLETAASDIYDHLVVQGNSWLSLDSLQGDSGEEEGCDSDASLQYLAEEVAAGMQASLPLAAHHLALAQQHRLEPWSCDTSLAGSCYGDIPNEPSSGLGSSACSSSWRLGGAACGPSPDTSASSWRLGGGSSCQQEDSCLSEEPSLQELPAAYLPPSSAAGAAAYKHLLSLHKPPHKRSGLGKARVASPQLEAVTESWVDRLKTLLVCGGGGAAVVVERL